MSGHSKWNNIKNRKGAADAKRSQEFAIISRGIRLAVRQGKSGDPKFNASLRLMLEKARAVNMPNDNIKRAIDAGLGLRDGKSIQEIVYEGFGPGGAGLLIVAMTDNTQRTSSELRFILSRHHGSLGSPGSAQYLFTHNSETGEYTPMMSMPVTDPEQQSQLSELMDALRENPDVEAVYCSAEVDQENGEVTA